MRNPGSTYSDFVNRFQSEKDAQIQFSAIQHILTDLRRIIIELGLESLVGITLLHRHFDLNKGEVLIRKHAQNSTVQITPGRLTKKLIPNVWAIGSQLIPISFLLPPAYMSHELPPKLITSANSLTFQLSSLLESYNATYLLGIILLDRSSHFKSHTGFLESTNVESRTSIMRPTIKSDPSFANAVPTAWRFDESDIPIVIESCC